MPAALNPDNEAKRLDALKKFKILDTDAESDYDQIVKLASFICDTPIALISLVDQDRQWFKAKIGVDACETHRDLAFCAHAILDPSQILIVENATKDPRFSDNILVTGELGIRFYAGLPLITHDDHALGTLCVIDTKPRTITPQQIEALQILGSNIISILELRNKNKECNILIKKLEESNKDLERFSCVASHDLKEPLRMIANFSELLRKRNSDSLDERSQNYMRVIFDATDRMDCLINDLLDYYQVGSTISATETVNVKDMINKVLDILESAIEQSNAKIYLAPHFPVLQCSPVLLQQIFQNLIGNALKYQPENNIPEIHIDYHLNETHHCFSINDNGIGIDTKYAQDIFEPFKRLHNKEEYQGTGIGLAICRKAIERLDGQIWIESALGQGCAFHFKIPNQG
jgi:signal transduction histidine kinase